jgi:hypothetical protein
MDEGLCGRRNTDWIQPGSSDRSETAEKQFMEGFRQRALELNENGIELGIKHF